MKPEIVIWQYRHFNSDGHPCGWISHDNEKNWAGSLRGNAAAKIRVESRELVTHADYRELEEELAALRGKVSNLVGADIAYDNAYADDVFSGSHDNSCKLNDAVECRRKALEALK